MLILSHLGITLQDRERLLAALDAAITQMEAKFGGATPDVKNVRRALDDVNTVITRIEEAWIRGRLSRERLEQLERQADERKAAIEQKLYALTSDSSTHAERDPLLAPGLRLQDNALLRQTALEGRHVYIAHSGAALHGHRRGRGLTLSSWSRPLDAQLLHDARPFGFQFGTAAVSHPKVVGSWVNAAGGRRRLQMEVAKHSRVVRHYPEAEAHEVREPSAQGRIRDFR